MPICPGWAHGVEIQLFNEIAERLNLVPRYKAIAKRPSTSTHLWYEKDLTSGTDMAFCGIIVSSKKITKVGLEERTFGYYGFIGCY